MLRALKRLEDHDLVDAVEELRPEVWRSASMTPRPRRRSAIVLPRSAIRAAEVAGHDDDRVLEVDRASLAVGQPPVVEHLQQDVEDVRWAFSISSNSTTQ